MTLVGNQVSDLVRLTVFPNLGWPGNVIKMGTYRKNVVYGSVPKQKYTTVWRRGDELCILNPQKDLQHDTN